MKPTAAFNVLLSCLALGAPVGAILLSRAGEAAVISPFGWPHLAVVHVLAVVALGFQIASLMRWAAPGLRRGPTAAVCIIVAVAVSGLTALYGSEVGRALDQRNPEFFARLLIRSLWCLALTLPWCGAIAALAPKEAARPPRLGWWILLCLVAVALPGIFAHDSAARQSAVAEELLARRQFRTARPIVAALADVGSWHIFGQRSAAKTRDFLADELHSLDRKTAEPLPLDASAEERMTRAVNLAILGRFDNARQTIEDPAAHDADAALLLAAILQDAGHWGASTQWYEQAIKLLDVGEIPRSETAPRLVTAYQGLAYNAREQGRYRDAARFYDEALERAPEQAAMVHFLLGQHYQLGGRPALAADEFQRAIELDAARFAVPAGTRLHDLRLQSPACFLIPVESLRTNPGTTSTGK